MDNILLGGKVRARRKQLGWTQGKLAQKLLVSVDYVSRIEKGERTPSERTKADLDDFLEGRGAFAPEKESGLKAETDEIDRLEAELRKEKELLTTAEFYRVMAGVYGVLEDMRKEREGQK
jgi:transcriptional regulator with XRE-family HTH domain